jgi:transitional endoplasmic reticulum ATPase
VSAPLPLPPWTEELRRRYLRGESSQFVLHGNVHDLVLHDGRLLEAGDFLADVLLAPTKDLVVRYDLSSGVRFAKRGAGAAELDALAGARHPGQALPALERLLLGRDRVAVLLEYAEMIAPAGDPNFFGETDRQSVIALHRWSTSPALQRADNLVLLVAEHLSELSPKVAANPRIAAVRVPMPDAAARRAAVTALLPAVDSAWADRLAEVTAGLKIAHIRALLEPTPSGDDDPATRERLVRELLGGAPNAEERARKLARLTAGLAAGEIRDLLAPGAPASPSPPTDVREEVLRLVACRKRELIERECLGLVEFVEPRHGLDAVGGMEDVKRELAAVAAALREGRASRCPMGLLFTGPMGTGKTFVAEAFVREAGLTGLTLKNFRSKWVGATEANLERILSVVKALGQVIVLVDEGDRAFGGEGGESDGGTSSRVMARLKEFMSDTGNRGRILFVVMTNRPDKLDVDLKRAGRLDRKIPFLYPQEPAEVEPVMLALLERHRIAHDLEFPRDRALASAPLVGYSNAEIEAVVLLAAELAGDARVAPPQVAAAIADYLPSRDEEMLEYMELVAVFEASSRRMLPRKYAQLSAAELQARLLALRTRVSGRR